LAVAASTLFGVDVTIHNIPVVRPSIKWWEIAPTKPGWKIKVDVSESSDLKNPCYVFSSGTYTTKMC